MLHMLAAVLMVAFGLSACTNAYGKGILNLELLCEGNVGVELNESNMPMEGKGYGRLLLSLIMAQAENDTINFQSVFQSKTIC